MKLNAEYKELCLIHFNLSLDNKKKKYANRIRMGPMDSMDEMSDEGYDIPDQDNEASPGWHQMESEGINSSVADKAVIAKEIRGLDIKVVGRNK